MQTTENFSEATTSDCRTAAEARGEKPYSILSSANVTSTAKYKHFYMYYLSALLELHKANHRITKPPPYLNNDFNNCVLMQYNYSVIPYSSL